MERDPKPVRWVGSSRRDLRVFLADLIKQRLAAAEQDYRERHN
jgi:hypothetical protein